MAGGQERHTSCHGKEQATALGQDILKRFHKPEKGIVATTRSMQDYNILQQPFELDEMCFHHGPEAKRAFADF